MSFLMLRTFFTSKLGIGLIIALLLGGAVWFTYNAGQNSVQAEWDLEKARITAYIAELEAKSAIINTETVIKYVDRIKTVTAKGDTIVKEIPKYITVVDDSKCTINNGTIRVLDAAARQTDLPVAPGNTNANPSDVKLSEVVASAGRFQHYWK